MGNGNVIYIAGPMRGKRDLNREGFHHARMFLIQRFDWVVINPACLPYGLPETAYMPICLAMLQQADAIGLLPGWEDSEGANLELSYAQMTGKRVIVLAQEYGYTGTEDVYTNLYPPEFWEDFRKLSQRNGEGEKET